MNHSFKNHWPSFKKNNEKELFILSNTISKGKNIHLEQNVRTITEIHFTKPADN